MNTNGHGFADGQVQMAGGASLLSPLVDVPTEGTLNWRAGICHIPKGSVKLAPRRLALIVVNEKSKGRPGAEDVKEKESDGGRKKTAKSAALWRRVSLHCVGALFVHPASVLLAASVSQWIWDGGTR